MEPRLPRRPVDTQAANGYLGILQIDGRRRQRLGKFRLELKKSIVAASNKDLVLVR